MFTGYCGKNRRILADLCNDGRTKVHKDALFALGYNFSFLHISSNLPEGKSSITALSMVTGKPVTIFIELKHNSQYLDYQ